MSSDDNTLVSNTAIKLDKNHMSERQIKNSTAVKRQDFHLEDPIPKNPGSGSTSHSKPRDERKVTVKLGALLLMPATNNSYEFSTKTLSEADLKAYLQKPSSYKGDEDHSAEAHAATTTMNQIPEKFNFRPNKIICSVKYRCCTCALPTVTVSEAAEAKLEVYNLANETTIVMKDSRLIRDPSYRTFTVELELESDDTTETLVGEAYLDRHMFNKPQWIQMRKASRKKKGCAQLCVLIHDVNKADIDIGKVNQDTDFQLKGDQTATKPKRCSWVHTITADQQPIPDVVVGPGKVSDVDRSDDSSDDDDDLEEKEESESAAPYMAFPKPPKNIFIRDFPQHTIEPDTAVVSTNYKALAVFQTDGNLVVYHRNSVDDPFQYVWASWTHESGANQLVPQADNNLVLYNAWGPVFWTGTDGWFPGEQARLGLQDDGNLLWYLKQTDKHGNEIDQVGVVLWHTGTGRLLP